MCGFETCSLEVRLDNTLQRLSAVERLSPSLSLTKGLFSLPHPFDLKSARPAMTYCHAVPLSGGPPPEESEDEDWHQHQHEAYDDYDDDHHEDDTMRTDRDICVLPGCDRNRQHAYG